jgi:hypothetical protein
MNAQGIKKSWSMNKSSLPGPKLKTDFEGGTQRFGVGLD